MFLERLYQVDSESVAGKFFGHISCRRFLEVIQPEGVKCGESNVRVPPAFDKWLCNQPVEESVLSVCGSVPLRSLSKYGVVTNQLLED